MYASLWQMEPARRQEDPISCHTTTAAPRFLDIFHAIVICCSVVLTIPFCLPYFSCCTDHAHGLLLQRCTPFKFYAFCHV